MTNSNCFFCFEPLTDNYVNVHPKNKFAHLCHIECLQEYQMSTLKVLTARCPLCREPMNYLEDEVRKRFPQPNSFEEWMSLINYFQKQHMAGHEIVIFFFGENCMYNLPIKGSKANLSLQKFVLNATNDFYTLVPFYTNTGWDALAHFIAHYDMVELGKRAMLLGGRYIP